MLSANTCGALAITSGVGGRADVDKKQRKERRGKDIVGKKGGKHKGFFFKAKNKTVY